MNINGVPATADQIKLIEVGIDRLAAKAAREQAERVIAKHQQKLDDTMAQRERRVVVRETRERTQTGEAIVFEYLSKREDGSVGLTDVAHEAATWMDYHEAHAAASRAERELSGHWRAMPTRQLGRMQGNWIRLQPSRATISL